jgi:hypothetical protein
MTTMDITTAQIIGDLRETVGELRAGQHQLDARMDRLESKVDRLVFVGIGILGATITTLVATLITAL